MDYEKLHKDTINKLQQMVNSGKITSETARGICADFVPESEDERIGKALIGHLKECRNNTRSEVMLGEYAKWIDWLEEQGKIVEYYEDKLDRCACENFNKGYKKALEKQGEHANFCNKIQIGDKVTRNEDGVLVNLSQLNRVAKKQGEQKLILDVEIPFGAKDSDLQEASYHIPEGFHAEIEGNNVIIKKGEQNNEWSEEDEKKRIRIMHRLSLDGTINNKDLSDINDWLKSLKDRYTWKPSDEQMKALYDSIPEMVMAISEREMLLNSLYKDLRKLREK